MLNKQINVFEKLKKTPSIDKPRQSVPDIFFQLKFNEMGAYIRIVDKKQNEIETDYRHYSGHIRDTLRSIESIREKNSFLIDWEKPHDRIYLSEYDFLLWELQRCNNFVDSDLNPIHFVEGKADLILRIEGEDQLVAKIFLIHQGKDFPNTLFLNETHVFVNGQIFEVHPVGENFSNINLFVTQLKPKDLEKYLSLFYSYLNNISIQYKGYQHIEGTSRHTRPTLLFEKVDPDNSLYLRVTNSLPGFEVDFFDNYDISRVASLNELEDRIIISNVIQEELYSHIQEIT
ncbi:MAG: hypothetical protein V1872_05015, partial [bacterium]